MDSDRPEAPDVSLEILLLEVDGQRFALSLSHVREILRAVSVLSLPGAPEVIDGLIDLRGEAVPLLNLRHRFGLPRRDVHPTEHFVVARAGERTMALRADRAVGVAEVAAGDVESSRQSAPRIQHVSGVVHLPDGMALIHDPARFLAASEQASLDAALDAVYGNAVA